MSTPGHIRQRSARSWEIKYDADSASGRRVTRYVSVNGSKRDARRRLTQLLAAVDAGTEVAPDKTTVAIALRTWLGGPHGLSAKTAERYGQLAEQQIIPFIGRTMLQKLKPGNVSDWHDTLLVRGGKNGAPLSTGTVVAAHKLLRKILGRAVAREELARNVAAGVRPPKVDSDEVAILQPGEIEAVLKALKGHPRLMPIAIFAPGTGMRRGEILALTWEQVNLDFTARVERSLEQTRAGLRFKSPKTKGGKRTVTLPATVVDMLRAHRLRQLELRVAVGGGRPEPDALVFCGPEGEPIPPDYISAEWRRFTQTHGLPNVTFHALRHTHVSILIAGGVDVVSVSRRIGHANASTTLNIYSHLFKKTDTAAAAIEAILRTSRG